MMCFFLGFYLCHVIISGPEREEDQWRGGNGCDANLGVDQEEQGDHRIGIYLPL